jgi:ribosomal 50S subunit-recycling heat shock protein
MRLDKFLKVSRIIKRRTVASQAASMGKVTVNGRPAKPASSVNAGDIIEIEYGRYTETYEVLRTAETAGKAEAAELFRLIGRRENEGSEDE